MVANPLAVWHGTQEETEILMAAISKNCECRTDREGRRLDTCGPHGMLVAWGAQRTLDTLLFYRRLSKRLLTEEGIRRP